MWLPHWYGHRSSRKSAAAACSRDAGGVSRGQSQVSARLVPWHSTTPSRGGLAGRYALVVPEPKPSSGVVQTSIPAVDCWENGSWRTVGCSRKTSTKWGLGGVLLGDRSFFQQSKMGLFPALEVTSKPATRSLLWGGLQCSDRDRGFFRGSRWPRRGTNSALQDCSLRWGHKGGGAHASKAQRDR